MATGEGLTVDVDKTWNPDSGLSLDEHRQIELARIQQPGFGQPEPVSTPEPQVVNAND
jgi:hypothetical protein